MLSNLSNHSPQRAFEEAPAKGERDLEVWTREIEELAAQIPAEDFDRVEAALVEADIEAKEIVRRQMGLS